MIGIIFARWRRLAGSGDAKGPGRRWIRSHSLLDSLVSGSLAAFGLMLFLAGPVAGGLAVLGGGLLAAELLLRRAAAPLALGGIVAIGGSWVAAPGQHALVLGLFYVAALALPLSRGRGGGMALTLALSLAYAAGFANAHLLDAAELPWWHLWLNLLGFSLAAAISYELALGRRQAEQSARELDASLAQQLLFAQDLQRALREARALRAELAARAEGAEALHAELQRVDRQREEFLSLVSHELRQPVAAIAVTAEVLAETPGLDPAEQRALEHLRHQAHSLARLAEDVLAVARLESGQFQLRPMLVDLGALVAGLAREASEPERLRLQLPAEPALVEADPERLGQVVDNLVRNAQKYSPPGTSVDVEVGSSATEAWVAVHDQGVGLEPGELAQLFQKYGRVRNERTARIQGVGLGLYLARLLVEAHGGQVEAASPGPGQGATFTLRLPGRKPEGSRLSAVGSRRSGVGSRQSAAGSRQQAEGYGRK